MTGSRLFPLLVAAPLFLGATTTRRTEIGSWPNGAMSYERHFVGDREE